MKEIDIQKKLHNQSLYIDCTTCKGEGSNYGYECSECKGTGKVRKPQPKRNFKKTLL
jgi:DnaJ-class molecular chaperone